MRVPSLIAYCARNTLTAPRHGELPVEGCHMRRLRSTAAGLLSAIAFAGPAFAADMPVERRPQQQAQRAPAQQQANWSGSQVGGFSGGSSVSNGFAEPGSNLFFQCVPFGGTCVTATTATGLPDTETPFNFDKDKLSFTFGGFLGYRWQFGSFVAGVEGDAAWKRGETTASLDVVSRASYHFPFPTSSPFERALRVENFYGQSLQTWDASIRARLGWLVTPSVLVYGTGGVAFGEVQGAYTYNAINNYAGFLDLTHIASAAG